MKRSWGKNAFAGVYALVIASAMAGCAATEPFLPEEQDRLLGRQCIERLTTRRDVIPAPERGDSDLRERLTRRYTDIMATVLDFGNGYVPNDDRNAIFSWREAALLESYLNVYLTERNTALLERFVKLAEAMIAHRDDLVVPALADYRGRVRPVWSTKKYSQQNVFAFAVQTGMITYPMARFVEAVRADESIATLQLADGRTVGAIADAMLSRVRESVEAFEEEWNQSKRAYFFPRDATFLKVASGSSYGGFEQPYNQQHALGRTIAILGKITGEERYKARVRTMVERFRDAIQVNSATCGYVWKYAPWLEGTEDVLHGSITVDFMLAARRTQRAVTEGELQLLAWTFSDQIRKMIGITSHLVDGSSTQPQSTVWVTYSGWLGLEGYEPLILQDVRLLFQEAERSGFTDSSKIFVAPGAADILGLSKAIAIAAGQGE